LLRATNDIKQVAAHGDILLMVIPTPFVERTVRAACCLLVRVVLLVVFTSRLLSFEE
jgi:glycerol-3-phosphate dehydrogenase